MQAGGGLSGAVLRRMRALALGAIRT
jgi:hypothetical protein